jgi:hypothetical protein
MMQTADCVECRTVIRIQPGLPLLLLLLVLCMRSYTRIARCSGHSSYVRHLDWSANSRVVQSSCGAYELLYFDAATGKQVGSGCCMKEGCMLMATIAINAVTAPDSPVFTVHSPVIGSA